MKRRLREKLPPMPSGTELLDMQWRDLAPQARKLFAVLPACTDESWATVAGIKAYATTLALRERGERALASTPASSTLMRMRRREAERLDALANDQTLNIVTALKRRICADWPNATPEQVLLLIAGRFRALSDALPTATSRAES